MIHNNEIVSIEEVLIKAHLYFQSLFTRKFIFTNRNSNLKICIHTYGARVESCELNNHQIIVNSEALCTETNWNSHVFGFDTLSLSSSGSMPKTFLYQVTNSNELVIEGKGFNSSAQPLFIFNPFFFNLVRIHFHLVI